MPVTGPARRTSQPQSGRKEAREESAPAQRKKAADDARIFVPPHAPDDPGTEASEPEEEAPLRPQRA